MSVATATKLWRLSATELPEAIRSRQLSSHEAIQAHLQRMLPRMTCSVGMSLVG